MNNFANTIRYIFRLIKETPKTLNIIASHGGFIREYVCNKGVLCRGPLPAEYLFESEEIKQKYNKIKITPKTINSKITAI